MPQCFEKPKHTFKNLCLRFLEVWICSCGARRAGSTSTSLFPTVSRDHRGGQGRAERGPGCHRPLKGAHVSPTAVISSRVTLKRTQGRCSSDFISLSKGRHSGGRKHRGKASGTRYYITHRLFQTGKGPAWRDDCSRENKEEAHAPCSE